MGKPAARITDFHACPMVTPGTPPIPHVGGPIAMGSPNVLTGKLAQARVGDQAVCAGPMDVIAVGSTGVFVNKKAAARMGDQTAHGGTIAIGLPTVLIGETKAGGGGGAALLSVASALQFADFAAQVQVLISAYQSGAPFCEICFQKAAAKLKTPAPAPAAKAPAAKAPASTPAHVAAPPPSKPAPVQNQIVCEAIGHTVVCEHGRKQGPENVLMVVPSSLGGGDTVSGQITMKGGCGEHPAWTVTGARGFQGKGSKYSFRASAMAPLTITADSLKQVSPETYRVEASSCHSGAPSYEVRAYPGGDATFKLGLTSFREGFHKFLDVMPAPPETKAFWKDNVLKGEMKFSGGWREDKKSWQAYFEDNFTAAFSPLIGVTHKGPIYPLTLVPGWLEKYVKAGFFWSVSLGLNLAGSFASRYWPVTGKTELGKREVSGGGSGKLSVSLEMKLVDPALVEGSLSGSTGVGVKAALAYDEHATFEITPKWDGIKGTATIKMAWGLVEFSRDFQIMAERKYDAWKWQLDKTEKEA